METNKNKVSSGAIQLYNLFIHGEIDRRAFMEGLQKFATGSIAVAALAEALMPNYAAGQQVSRTDERIKAGYEAVPSPQGNGTIKGYLVRPISASDLVTTACTLYVPPQTTTRPPLGAALMATLMWRYRAVEHERPNAPAWACLDT